MSPYKDRHAPHVRTKIAATRARRIAARNVLTDSFLDDCVDCGNEDWEVLEFDHVHAEPLRKSGVRSMLGDSRESLLREIAKCEVRCANCHKKRHREELA